jgi:hypothetical protein
MNDRKKAVSAALPPLQPRPMFVADPNASGEAKQSAPAKRKPAKKQAKRTGDVRD